MGECFVRFIEGMGFCEFFLVVLEALLLGTSEDGKFVRGGEGFFEVACWWW